MIGAISFPFAPFLACRHNFILLAMPLIRVSYLKKSPFHPKWPGGGFERFACLPQLCSDCPCFKNCPVKLDKHVAHRGVTAKPDRGG